MRVSDALVSACSRTLATLAAGASQSWTCRYTMGAATITNTASGQACPDTVNTAGCSTPVVSTVVGVTVERDRTIAYTGTPAVRQSLAALALLGRGLPVTRVAAELGYASASAFTAAFRRALGAPPSRYLRGEAATKAETATVMALSINRSNMSGR